ncbi:molybdopterin-guanine dinucleotide biosynthesis protein B [Massilia sp. W12]|uniref:molybdopterin-guanine dinucleotide biosynthesis protein B n=1 Tax=Massilia sp. W12 TaxID=3126507 RepID=UPI0030D2A2E9
MNGAQQFGPQRNVLGVVGWSGSGKTSLLEQLLSLLCAQGLTVHAIKHSHHDFSLEPEHKDSARLRRAGATQVLLSSPYRWALVHELRGAPEPDLAQQLARLAPADLVLVEGFKFAPIKRLEVHRPALGKPALYLEDEHIIGVASDAPAGPAARAQQPDWLDLNQAAQIAAWVHAKLAQGLLRWPEEMQDVA